MKKIKWWQGLLIGVALAWSAHAGAAAPDGELTSENKPWTRWWWLGSAVDKANLTRELEAFAAAGFGGVEITPIYGAKGAEARNLQFLSDPYVEMLAHVTREAKRLGLGVDMATGTGWPFGGPFVAASDVELEVDFAGGKLATRPTGFTVKRAAPGGAGPVLNPYSPQGMARYLAPFSRALAKLPPGALRGQFHDSFEYKATWVEGLPEKFIARHGYDLRDHLAELGGTGDADRIARIKADFRQTVAELHYDYIATWVKWAHAQGQIARNQAHGSPGNLLDLYALADIPETELFGAQKYPVPGFRREPGDLAPDPASPLVHRLASSAAHVAGRKLASSETFTWLREHFREAPSQMKPEVDQLFLTGINHLFYHGTAYSPDDVPWPGWLFYASTQANPRNPLWNDLAELNGYIGRCQARLQGGVPDNDILLYWPLDDLWHREQGVLRRLSVHANDWLAPTPAGRVAAALVEGGYAFDFVSDRQLGEARVENGALQTPGGAYRTVLIPRTEHMSVATLQRLLALANDGATILVHEALPADVPGFGSLEQRRAQFKAQLARLEWESNESSNARIARMGRGRVILSESLPELLSASGASREPLVERGLRFVRRRLPGGWLYFVANLSGGSAEGWVALGRPARAVELYDPLSQRRGTAALRAQAESAEVYLQLRPGESVFLQTSDRPLAGVAWNYFRQSGAAIDLDGPWRLSFLRGGPELPGPRTLTVLHSWADDPADPAAERFAGTGRYELEFNLPGHSQGDAWRLELGEVREAAKISLNGGDPIAVWGLPADTLLLSKLKAGRNTLVVEVTNTAANRVRDLDQRGVPWKNGKNFVNISYKPFDAAQWPIQPSGLLGPVKLVPLRRLTVESLK